MSQCTVQPVSHSKQIQLGDEIFYLKRKTIIWKSLAVKNLIFMHFSVQNYNKEAICKVLYIVQYTALTDFTLASSIWLIMQCKMFLNNSSFAAPAIRWCGSFPAVKNHLEGKIMLLIHFNVFKHAHSLFWSTTFSLVQASLLTQLYLSWHILLFNFTTNIFYREA
jgi:hypothetical protein